MRLKDVYLLCKDYIEKVPEVSMSKLVKREINETCYTLNTQNIVWKEIVKELDDLEQISALSVTVKEIKDIIFDNGKVREIYVETAKDSLIKNFRLLYVKMQTIKDLCESFGYLSGEYVGFDIKVPVKKDFSAMAKILNDFDKIINQAPFLKESDAKIQYRKVDLGSTWLEFVITGSAAVTLLEIFATFIDNCIAILSHKKSCQQQEECYRRMKISNDLVEGMCTAHQEMTEKLTDKFVNELSGKLEPEDQARARLCFDMMVELLDEGVEIYEAIAKKESNELLFPTSEQWEKIGSNSLKSENIEEKQ